MVQKLVYFPHPRNQLKLIRCRGRELELVSSKGQGSLHVSQGAGTYVPTCSRALTVSPCDAGPPISDT